MQKYVKYNLRALRNITHNIITSRYLEKYEETRSPQPYS